MVQVRLRGAVPHVEEPGRLAKTQSLPDDEQQDQPLLGRELIRRRPKARTQFLDGETLSGGIESAVMNEDGDYAFVIWDDERRRALAVRDRFAATPLCYEPTADGIRFASEVKQLAITSSPHSFSLYPSAILW